MERLFDLRSGFSAGVMYPQNWTIVKDNLLLNLNKTIQFYRSNPMAVPSEHLLVQMIQNVGVPKSLETNRYYEAVSDMAGNLSMAMGLTSAIYKGKLFKGVFYSGNNIEEILIHNNEPIYPEEVVQDWMNIRAVEVLYHSVTDLSLLLPDGKQNTTDAGFSVVSINIALLLLQYRAFRIAESKVRTPSENPYSIMQFVHMYVIPNMLHSHIDQVLFNRIATLGGVIPTNGVALKRHSFSLIDLTLKLDNVQKVILDNLSHSTRNMHGILKSIPAISKKDMDEVMYVPGITQTSQVMWALMMSRLITLEFLIKLSTGNATVKNQQEMNYFLRMILKLRNNNILQTTLSPKLNLFVESKLTELVTLVTS